MSLHSPPLLSSLLLHLFYFFIFLYHLVFLPPVFFLFSRYFHSSSPSPVFCFSRKGQEIPVRQRRKKVREGRGEKPGRPCDSGSHSFINRRKAFRAREQRFPGTWRHIVPRHGRKRKFLLPLQDFFPGGNTILPAGESILRTG